MALPLNRLPRAESVVPGGVSTYSKARSQLPFNAPEAIVSGSGSHIRSSDGREFLDWTMGLGALTLGYLDPDVTAALEKQIRDGTIFGISHELEVTYAEELIQVLPWADAMVRYGKNGSDATSAAVRAARYITGRDRVFSIGYHGWHVEVGGGPNKNGVPDSAAKLVGDCPIPLDRILGGMPGYATEDWACLLIEPDLVKPEALRYLRHWCDQTKTLLVFDEILTGFRMPKLFAARHYGVSPDLICLGKGMSNGVPLSAVVGPAKHMRVFAGAVGVSGTYMGETLGLSAALATLRKYRRLSVVDRLWEIGTTVQRAWNDAAQAHELDMPCTGIAPRSVIRYPSPAHKTLVLEQMFKRGICFTVGFNACYAHSTDDLDRTKAAIAETLELVASVKNPAALCEGPIVSPMFRPQG